MSSPKITRLDDVLIRMLISEGELRDMMTRLRQYYTETDRRVWYGVPKQFH